MDWIYPTKGGEWEKQTYVSWESGEMIQPVATAGVPWLCTWQGTEFAFLASSPLTQDYVPWRGYRCSWPWTASCYFKVLNSGKQNQLLSWTPTFISISLTDFPQPPTGPGPCCVLQVAAHNLGCLILYGLRASSQVWAVKEITACARCSSSQAYFPHSMRKIHASLPEWITDTIFNYRTYVLPPTPQWLLKFYIWQKQASRPLKGVACISLSSSCQPLQGPGAGLQHTWKWGRFRQQFGTQVT